MFIRARSTAFKVSHIVTPHSYCVRWGAYFYSPIPLKTGLKQRGAVMMQGYIQEESGLEPSWTQNQAPLSSAQSLSTYLGGSSDISEPFFKTRDLRK